MVDLQRRARLGSKALFALAKSRLFLLVAGGPAEVCGRSADIVDISLEARFLVRSIASFITDSSLLVCILLP